MRTSKCVFPHASGHISLSLPLLQIKRAPMWNQRRLHRDTIGCKVSHLITWPSVCLSAWERSSPQTLGHFPSVTPFVSSRRHLGSRWTSPAGLFAPTSGSGGMSATGGWWHSGVRWPRRAHPSAVCRWWRDGKTGTLWWCRSTSTSRVGPYSKVSRCWRARRAAAARAGNR